eukprot:COSAG06_NODE_253_length_19061_cov_33.083114_13_plen_35_part_00
MYWQEPEEIKEMQELDKKIDFSAVRKVVLPSNCI